MFKRLSSSVPWVWISAGMLSISLVAVLGVMLLIGSKGLSYFWPTPIYQWQIATPSGVRTYFGQLYQQQSVAPRQLLEAGVQLKQPEAKQERLLLKIANRDREGQDFISVLAQDVLAQSLPPNVAEIERHEHGRFFGIPIGIIDENGVKIALNAAQIADKAQQAKQNYQHQKTLEAQLSALNQAIYHHQPAAPQQLERQQQLTAAILRARAEFATQSLLLQDSNGQEVALPWLNLLTLWYPNAMSLWDKMLHWGEQVARFVTDAPRDANSAGGVFPAIFGTVLMVLLMAIMVMPLGVLAAIYLHEYAAKNWFTRMIRMAVVNLAGVPSVVYGVFGLGFFVYFIGGNLDKLFYADTLPTPTFGTPGLLWSSLTLAILTLPVVIVSTEEGLARIPLAIRQGSLALGATKAETLWHIVLPMATPAMMTGLILAIARAAGEVAPLMLVGVVKVAPSLPLDGQFPFLHLERKFMHLGFHIYDVGFQTPNIEVARPLVFATALLLVLVIVILNVIAVMIRNHLREKYRALEQQHIL